MRTVRALSPDAPSARDKSAREGAWRARAQARACTPVVVDVWSCRLGLVYALHCHRCTECCRTLPATRPMISRMPPGCQKKGSAVRTNVRTALGCKPQADHAQASANNFLLTGAENASLRNTPGIISRNRWRKHVHEGTPNEKNVSCPDRWE